MNRQQIFDRVAKHLLKQGRPSKNRKGACMYRGLNGTKCAIGCLIPDELYSRYMENTSIFSQMETPTPRWIPVVKLLGRRNAALLDSLQAVHDDESSWLKGRASVRAALRAVAKKSRLSVNF